jgi:hypothetical protein
MGAIMGTEHKRKFTIRADDYRKWLGNRGDALLPVVDLHKPTIRSVVCLSLLERMGKESTYEDINRAIGEAGVVDSTNPVPVGPIHIPTIRNELSDLMSDLDLTAHRYQLKEGDVTEGKKTFKLVYRDQPEHVGGVLKVVDPPVIDLRIVATQLVRFGGGLPFASQYASYRAAASWLSFSTFHAVQKARFEADAFYALGLKVVLGVEPGKRINFVSLACGEGLGEAELLGRLLRDEQLYIDYVAVDSSEMLLLAHAKLVFELYRDEIHQGRLAFTPVVGNMYELGRHIEAARGSRGESYLGKNATLVSYLGNCIGNEENTEEKTFNAALDAFPDVHPIAFLVGASTVLGKDGHRIVANYTIDSFVLETPRHLLYDLKHLESVKSDNTRLAFDNPLENGEFILRNDEKAEPVLKEPYSNRFNVRGDVYRFFYTLKRGLRTWDKQDSVAAGTRLMLYSIIKYELDTLLGYLRARGFDVRPEKAGDCKLLYMVDDPADLDKPEKQHSYAVFAVIRP